MTDIEWYFAYASHFLDVKEDNRRIRNIVLSHASLTSPNDIRDVVEASELEDELTDEEERELKGRSKRLFEDKIKNLDESGKVKSDSVIQELIRSRKNQTQPIESLSQIRDKENAR